MVFKAKYTSETYQTGATRIKRTFAFLPFRINGELVWLETYETYQLYRLVEHQAISLDDDKPKIYKIYEWVNLSHRIIR
jgi:hypothetical protein